MYYWRVFLWKNGQKDTEFTKYLVAPVFYEDKLDETLDTGEIILEMMPISTKKAFPPKTKIRMERYITQDFKDTPETFDMVVDHDDVEEFVGLENYCTHRINLIEASVIAQGMHVDNIALTYELQDIDLNYKTTISSETPSNHYVSPTQPSSGVAVRRSDSFNYTGTVIGGGSSGGSTVA